MENYVWNESLEEGDMALRFFVVQYLSDLMQLYFPHTKLLLFGSAVNGLGNIHGDLDITTVVRIGLSFSYLQKPASLVQHAIINVVIEEP